MPACIRNHTLNSMQQCIRSSLYRDALRLDGMSQNSIGGNLLSSSRAIVVDSGASQRAYSCHSQQQCSNLEATSVQCDALMTAEKHHSDNTTRRPLLPAAAVRVHRRLLSYRQKAMSVSNEYTLPLSVAFSTTADLPLPLPRSPPRSPPAAPSQASDHRKDPP